MRAKYPTVQSAAMCGAKGSVLVEFALILPLLIFFLFASYEFSKVLRMHQLVATTAREIARDAYRQCFGEKSFASVSANQSIQADCSEEVFTQACLEQVISNAKGLRNAALTLDAPFVSNLRIAISAFQYRSLAVSTGGTASSVVRVGYAVDDLTKEEPEPPPPGEDPEPVQIDDSFVRYTEEHFNTNQSLLDFAQANRYAIVTEVLGTYSLASYRLAPTLEVTFDPFGGRYYYVLIH